jgi:hypothetical protein
LSAVGSGAGGVSAAAATGGAEPAANNSSSSGTPPQAALARSSAPAASAGRPPTGSSSSRGLVRPASSGALTAGAAAAAAAAGSRGSNDAAAGEPPGSRRQKSVTVGQLAREDLLTRHSLLFGALQQQQQPLGQGGSARGASVPGNLPPAGQHRHAASDGGARFGAGASAAQGAASAAAAAAGSGYAQPISIDLRQLALVDALERGMSAPNTDIPLFSPPAGGSRGLQRPSRTER